MKVHEILSFNKELLEKLNRIHINVSDYRFVEMYEEYIRLKNDGLKTVYIVSMLSEVYNISERKVYKVLSKMDQII